MKAFKNYVYLAGPMEDCTEGHMKGWREVASRALGAADIESLDPTRRVAFHKAMTKLNDRATLDQSMCRRIFKMDLQDIASSTVVLADVRRDSGRGTGTSMELMFAHMKNKVIILWADEDDIPHPFYESIYTEKYSDLDDCIDAITYYYDQSKGVV
jgi:nucleoside 2-deoxyribosyltransferase